MRDGGLPERPETYRFLVGRLIDAATLGHAVGQAQAWRARAHEVLIALGRLDAADYARALAAHVGLPFVEETDLLPRRPRRLADLDALEVGWDAGEPDLVGRHGGRLLPVLAAEDFDPADLAARLAAHRDAGGFAVASRRAIEAARRRHRRKRDLHAATYGLARLDRAASASSGASVRQRVALAVLVGLVLGTMGVLPDAALIGWSALLTFPFLAIVLIRALALVHLLTPGRRPAEAARAADASLPTYSVLVPLYREAHMLPALVAALQRLDYPATRLDIRIVLEEADPETIAAARALDLPGTMTVIVVPDGQPRTKPKALDYALLGARGALTVIYDAEDAPEPDQLRKAAAAFRDGPPQLGCVQARLAIHNARHGWLTRQFALEYAALFDGILPSLARIGLPLPLGGTSNHFRTAALREVGAWDPFNVTEDADLGLRLHRRGWRAGVIASRTYEEAPERLGSWLRQRTRWLKGWMQTWVVHTRRVNATSPHSRLSGAIGVHVLLGAVLLSALLHPVVYVLLGAELIAGEVFERPRSLMGAGFWHIAMANLAIGVTASMLLGAVAALRRRQWRLALSALTMPLYWVLISVAAWRALWQLARDPFRWEKTEHRHPARGP